MAILAISVNYRVNDSKRICMYCGKCFSISVAALMEE